MHTNPTQLFPIFPEPEPHKEELLLSINDTLLGKRKRMKSVWVQEKSRQDQWEWMEQK